VGEIKDHEAFMETIVDRIVKVITTSPSNIYVNATFCPERDGARSTTSCGRPQRMQRVIDAARRQRVASNQQPLQDIRASRIVKLAKQAGIKFTCRHQQCGLDMGRDEYCIGMIQRRACGAGHVACRARMGRKASTRKAAGASARQRTQEPPFTVAAQKHSRGEDTRRTAPSQSRSRNNSRGSVTRAPYARLSRRRSGCDMLIAA